MKENIYCIYPKDSTTDFLAEIPKKIASFFGEKFQLFRVEPNDESHEEAIQLIIDAPSDTIFIFLGHGNSMALKGSEYEGYSNDFFIANDRMHIFNNKALFALACRSIELVDIAKYTTELSNFKCICFPNIISSYKELKEERNGGDLYINLEKEHIEIANSILVSSVIYALKGLSDKNGLKLVYKRLIQFINQEIVKIVLDEPNGVTRDIADMIYEMKKEIEYVII